MFKKKKEAKEDVPSKEDTLSKIGVHVMTADDYGTFRAPTWIPKEIMQSMIFGYQVGPVETLKQVVSLILTYAVCSKMTPQEVIEQLGTKMDDVIEHVYGDDWDAFATEALRMLDIAHTAYHEITGTPHVDLDEEAA